MTSRALEVMYPPFDLQIFSNVFGRFLGGVWDVFGRFWGGLGKLLRGFWMNKSKQNWKKKKQIEKKGRTSLFLVIF